MTMTFTYWLRHEAKDCGSSSNHGENEKCYAMSVGGRPSERIKNETG